MNIRQGYVFCFEDALKMQARSRLEIILSTPDLKPIITKSVNNSDQHNGPSVYPVKAKLQSLIAMILYNIATFTKLVERLNHDPMFRYNCGFDVFGKVPGIATISRFYDRLTNSEVLQELFQHQVQQAEALGLLDTSSIAIDARGERNEW